MKYFYEIGGHRYPFLILGCDSFLRPPFTLQKKEIQKKTVYQIMEIAYKYGIRGIDVNIESDIVFESFLKIKQNYPDVVGIGDPNMNPGFRLNGVPLKKYGKRINKTIFENSLSKNEKESILNRSEKYKKIFFDFDKQTETLMLEDILNITLDQHEWTRRIKMLSTCCDFCLFGADYVDWLLALGREDLIQYEINVVSSYMKPIMVCHWVSRTVPHIKKISQIDNFWLYANAEAMSIIPDEAIDIIRSEKNVTLFRIFRKLEGYNSVKEGLEWATLELRAKSIVVGAPITIKESCCFFNTIHNEFFLELTNRNKKGLLKL